MIKTLIAYLQSRSKANKRITELEEQLEEQTRLRRKFEHEVGVWVAKEENREEQQFLSPIQSERNWQERCLKAIYPEYPDICQWQLMNGLIRNMAKSCGIDIAKIESK